MATRAEDIVRVLRDGGAVRIAKGYELSARTFRGYEGRNPRTGAVVEVPPKTLPLLREATGDAVDLGVEEVAVLGEAPVSTVAGVGFIVGPDTRRTERTLLAFASFRCALNGRPLPGVVADDGAVRAAIAALPPVAQLVAAPSTSIGPPFVFEAPLPGEGLEGVAFASLGDFAWRLGERGDVIEASSEPSERLALDVFLAQAALVTAVTKVAGERTLSEEAAADTMRAMLEIHPTATLLAQLLPL